MERLQQLPELLERASGDAVDTAEQWVEGRRMEIRNLFENEVFGRGPKDSCELSFHVTETSGMMNGNAIRKQIDIQYSAPRGIGSFRLLLFLPAASVTEPVPVCLLINNRGPLVADPEQQKPSGFWPVELILSHGYGAAQFHVEEIDPDYDDGFRNGVHGRFDDSCEARSEHSWGTIAAWAWAASRAMDYLEADPQVDAKRVSVVGHSRGGKTALWAGALDERFAAVFSNNSGCTGAALSRGKAGETIEQINSTFPHWFAARYRRYNGREHELPFDQHMLLALLAPRPLYVASATLDDWADPHSEFLALVAAEPAYRLFGYTGLGTAEFPSPDTPLIGDRLGYHVRTGVHDLTEYDWSCFLTFLRKQQSFDPTLRLHWLK